MALTVQQQEAIHRAVKDYFEAFGAAADNSAAEPALAVRRASVRACILGPTQTFISDDKFWCLFDEMVTYVVAGGRMTNSLLSASTGTELNGAGIIEALQLMRRELGR